MVSVGRCWLPSCTRPPHLLRSAAPGVCPVRPGGPWVPVGAIAGHDDRRPRVAVRVIGGQRPIDRVDLPVATFTSGSRGVLLPPGLGHGDGSRRDLCPACPPRPTATTPPGRCSQASRTG